MVSFKDIAQDFKVIPRKHTVGGYTVNIVDEFTQDQETVSTTGNYLDGILQLQFNFQTKPNSTYKLKVIDNSSKVIWKGKART